MSPETYLPEVTICYGGGIDSTSLIQYYMNEGFAVKGIHFNYGQPSYPGEHKAAQKIAQHYNIGIAFAKIQPVIDSQSRNGYFGRNLLFVLCAINYFQLHSGVIALGIHAGTEYYDCTSQFTKHLQLILDGYSGGTIQLDTPFVDFTKSDILTYCKRWEVPISVTYSCEHNSMEPCGRCLSCLDRKEHDTNKPAL